jgi:hypothetical protein
MKTKNSRKGTRFSRLNRTREPSIDKNRSVYPNHCGSQTTSRVTINKLKSTIFKFLNSL